MAQIRAFYCVVQYLPDSGRAEAANTGVLLYVPSMKWLEVQVSPTLERVKQFFRPSRNDMRRIERALQAFEYRMEFARKEFQSEEDLVHFAAARADAMRVTAPRLALVDDPVKDLAKLYDDLVGDRIRAAPKAPQLPASVAEVFGRLEAQKRVWRPRPFLLPTVRRRISVPIAYQNGRVNYVKPESLASERKHTLDDRLTVLGFNGQLIHRHPVDDKPGQLVVLSCDPKADAELEDRFQQTLGDFNVRFVPFGQAHDFAAEVEREAH